jgi:hypothetical protein
MFAIKSELTVKEQFLVIKIHELSPRDFIKISAITEAVNGKKHVVKNIVERIAEFRLLQIKYDEAVKLKPKAISALEFLAPEEKLIELPDYTIGDYIHTGKKGKFDGKRIYKLLEYNPRRKKSYGWDTWELIENGMTYTDFRRKGGSLVDLAHDVKLGRILVE